LLCATPFGDHLAAQTVHRLESIMAGRPSRLEVVPARHGIEAPVSAALTIVMNVDSAPPGELLQISAARLQKPLVLVFGVVVQTA
jgi:hypothetical protein